ncbi:MAG: tetratricopeptide repeat protein [Myxococcales bacterium]|nr:tetratricopeptide repeat protein [Myxococcales bacterium]
MHGQPVRPNNDVRHQPQSSPENPSRGALLVIVSLCLPAFGCPENPLREAYQAQSHGQLNEAGDTFLRVARSDPANLAAWDGAIAIFCQQRVHVARCLEVLDLELELLGTVHRHRDALSLALEGRASARMDRGLAQAAIEDLARAETVTPNRANIAVLQARAWTMLGQREEALIALERAFSLDSKHPELDLIRAWLPAPQATTTTHGDGFGGE